MSVYVSVRAYGCSCKLCERGEFTCRTLPISELIKEDPSASSRGPGLTDFEANCKDVKLSNLLVGYEAEQCSFV